LGSHRFFWLNIFRPLDPIGSTLHFERASNIHEVCVRQYFTKEWLLGNLLVQHMNYMGDARVGTIVTDFVRRILALDCSNQRHEAPNHAPAMNVRRPPPYLSWHFVKRCAALAWCIGTGLCLWLAFFELPRIAILAELDTVSNVLRHARSTKGRLEASEDAHLRNPWSGKPLSAPMYLAQVVFRPITGPDRIVRTIPVDCDPWRAFQVAKKNGVVSKHPLGLMLAVQEDVDVVYDQTNPDRCFLPSFRSGKWTPPHGGQTFFKLILFAALFSLWTLFLRLTSGAIGVEAGTRRPIVPPRRRSAT
jgi:hypothetical protein